MERAERELTRRPQSVGEAQKAQAQAQPREPMISEY